MDNVLRRNELLRQITAVNFLVEDLHLYLNTHPMDRNAISLFNTNVMQLNAMMQDYEKHYGMLTAHRTPSPYPFNWISEPWPWEYEANFKLDGEEI